MRYGISAAALVVRDGQVLLVNHRETECYDFWVPPGGSLEGSESILECARRETREETGLEVELEHILYIQELWEPEYHFCKFFVLCKGFSGNLVLTNKQEEESFLVDARFFSRADLQGITVHPEILKEQFWDDMSAQHPVTRYLGIERMRY